MVRVAPTDAALGVSFYGRSAGPASLGLSEPPPSSAGRDVSEHLYKLARSFSPNGPFDLVAHDTGIWNTCPMAVTHGSDIRRSAFMEAPIRTSGSTITRPSGRMGDLPVRHFGFFAAGNHLAETLVAGRERAFLEHFVTMHAVNKAVFTPGLLDMYARRDPTSPVCPIKALGYDPSGGAERLYHPACRGAARHDRQGQRDPSRWGQDDHGQRARGHGHRRRSSHGYPIRQLGRLRSDRRLLFPQRPLALVTRAGNPENDEDSQRLYILRQGAARDRRVARFACGNGPGHSRTAAP